MRSNIAALLLSAISALGADTAVTPRFTDPARRARLEAAYPEIEAIFGRFREGRGIPGLAFGIVVDGEVAFLKGMGVRDLKSKEPVTADTVFRIASMTKSFTALAILELRDENRLALDDPAAKWIPELSRVRYPTRDSAPMTVRQLLTHGAGLPEDNPWGDRQLAAGEETLTRLLRAGLPFSTPPGTAYEYSNYGFALLGRIVSRASGASYRRYLESRILLPLGMKATSLEAAEVPAAVRAMGYRRSGNSFEEEASLPDGAFGAMGGLHTSARDLGRYVAFMLSAYPPRDEAERGPVRRSSLREMQHPWRPADFAAQRPAPDQPLNALAGAYGYGLRIRRDCRFSHTVSHGGGLPGFGSYMSWLPEHGVGIFALANLTYAAPAAAVDEAFDALRKTGALRPRELPASPDLISARDSIVRLWERWDEAEARSIAADNLFLDVPAAELRRRIITAKSDLGACREAGEVEPENLLRGKFCIPCARGRADVRFTLAPTIPPKVQYLHFSTAARLENRAGATASLLASLVGSFREDVLARMSAPFLDPSALRRTLEALRLSYGSCRLGETLEGDGRTGVRVRFECDRGPLDAHLRLDASGRLREAIFVKPPETPCVP